MNPMKPLPLSRGEKDVLVELLMLLVGDICGQSKREDGGWSEGATNFSEFGGREIRASFNGPFQKANPLAVFYGQRLSAAFEHEWRIAFRLPKNFPEHPRLNSSKNGPKVIAKSTHVFDVTFEGDKDAFARDLVFIKMVLS